MVYIKISCVFYFVHDGTFISTLHAFIYLLSPFWHRFVDVRIYAKSPLSKARLFRYITFDICKFRPIPSPYTPGHSTSQRRYCRPHAIVVAGRAVSLSRRRSRRLSRRELLRRSSSLREESRESSPLRGEEVVSRHSEDERFVWVPESGISKLIF